MVVKKNDINKEPMTWASVMWNDESITEIAEPTDAQLNEYGYARVKLAEPKYFYNDPFKKIERFDYVELNDGSYEQICIKRDATQEEIQIEVQVKTQEISEERLLLLRASDWTQLADVPLTAEKKAEWNTYRQALRDISAQEGYPFNVVWPTEPV